jgi:hypothetical protein
MTSQLTPERLQTSRTFSAVAQWKTLSKKMFDGRYPRRSACGTAVFRGLLILLYPLSGFAAYVQAPEVQTHDSAEVARALTAELKAAQDTAHPMRYQLRKSTPRLTSIKGIVETRDGAVARLLSINGSTPSDADRQKDDARLDALLADPGRQHKRKQGEQDDTARALKVLRSLPTAFLYAYAGSTTKGEQTLDRFTFAPNPKFDPPDLETQVLTALTGEISIDAAHNRVVRLEGHLQQDVDFGWGILGRLNKGGWIVIDQDKVSGDQWRIVRFQMVMSGRVLFKTRSFDTVEEESQFAPVPVGTSYQQAIEMLRSGPGTGVSGR